MLGEVNNLDFIVTFFRWGEGMLNMSLKIGEARESMSLETRKCTSSLERRIKSARGSLKGASANFSGGILVGFGDSEHSGFER